jgi:cytochrome c oxidase assembly protein subunit 17
MNAQLQLELKTPSRSQHQPPEPPQDVVSSHLHTPELYVCFSLTPRFSYPPINPRNRAKHIPSSKNRRLIPLHQRITVHNHAQRKGPSAFPTNPLSPPKLTSRIKTKQPCCVCKDEKASRDECMLFSTSDNAEEKCRSTIEAYKSCMAGYGFKMP